ncbi:TRAP transporter substrate-binding protein [Siccirubricoccus deserti]
MSASSCGRSWTPRGDPDRLHGRRLPPHDQQCPAGGEAGRPAGHQFRVLQSPIFIEMYRSLGGNAVPMAWGETFTAVQQGAIDGLEIPLGVIDQNKYYEVTKYLSLTGHIYSMNGLLISKRSFGRLPADLKAAVTEAGAEATREQRRSNAAAQAAFRESLARNGMQVNEVPDKAAFRRAVMPMYERFRAQIGADIVRDALAAVQ